METDRANTKHTHQIVQTRTEFPFILTGMDNKKIKVPARIRLVFFFSFWRIATTMLLRQVPGHISYVAIWMDLHMPIEHWELVRTCNLAGTGHHFTYV
jgi:hypothetical protein